MGVTGSQPHAVELLSQRNDDATSIDTPLHFLSLSLEIDRLTCLAPRLPGPVDGHLHALGVDGHLRRTRADRDRQVEALACNEKVENVCIAAIY